jgi:HEPN domain-containing protein
MRRRASVRSLCGVVRRRSGSGRAISTTSQIARFPTTDKWIRDAARDFRIGSSMMGSPFDQSIFPLRSAVVTLAFSIELYLKYLAAKSLGKAPKGHDLAKLFSHLPETVRDKIAKSYGSGRAIQQLLDVHKDAFIEWRYIYEQQGSSFHVDIGSLRQLCDALDATAGEYAES